MSVVTDLGVSTDLWHCRLQHMSKKEKKVLLSKGKLSTLKSVYVKTVFLTSKKGLVSLKSEGSQSYKIRVYSY